ncbi:MAG: 5'-nucleotidase [Cohaesibacter sp.]|jgi:5'-nucleotidase|nr:5'-nucleotidase [Cohaesibacter sp.]
MPYPIEKKLVIAVSSSALFDLTKSDKVFRKKGKKAYKKYQEKNLDRVLKKGVAFPFIKRFLDMNKKFGERSPVEVILLSKNSAATGKRVFRSIQKYGLDITRAAFVEGKSPYEYIPAFNASLFLSANEKDVKNANDSGHPAGLVLPSGSVIDDKSGELRIAFDFDGVIADDGSEKIVKQTDLATFHEHEQAMVNIPHKGGPLAELFHKISGLQKLEDELAAKDQNYRRCLRTAIITARNAPSHERVITTLEKWGVSPDETFFLGGMEKRRILEVFRPHMFFDDQKDHLAKDVSGVALVHIPFGIANQLPSKPSPQPSE